MAQTVRLSATAREKTGKGAARQARFQKQIPAVIYGHGRATQPLMVDALALEKALMGIEPESTLIDLTVDGKNARALIREIQRHPLRPDIIHVDFYEIQADEKVTLKVPVHLVGTPDGVRNAGGVLDQVTREVEIEVLPEHIPDRVELDVTALKIGDSLHTRDLTIPNAVILTGADLTIATVVPSRGARTRDGRQCLGRSRPRSQAHDVHEPQRHGARIAARRAHVRSRARFAHPR